MANVIKDIDGRGVATITLNRPDVHNAFDQDVIKELTETLMKMAQDRKVKVVILAARGKNFSAGADLRWMRQTADASSSENLDTAVKMAQMYKTLAELSKPTIALVQGVVIGGGVGLVAACDIVIAGWQATFGLSEVKLGLIPAVVSPHVIDAMGARAARRYFLTGERFSAKQARRLGLVHELVREDLLRSTGERMSEMLLANGPLAMAAVKELVAIVRNRPVNDELVAVTAKMIADIRGSKEGREGVNAFLAKRPPSWDKGGKG